MGDPGGLLVALEFRRREGEADVGEPLRSPLRIVGGRLFDDLGVEAAGRLRLAEPLVGQFSVLRREKKRLLVGTQKPLDDVRTLLGLDEPCPVPEAQLLLEVHGGARLGLRPELHLVDQGPHELDAPAPLGTQVAAVARRLLGSS